MTGETTGTDKQPPEAPITPPASDKDVESDAPGADAGGKAHTSTSEPHPAGDGERTDRETGGPKPG